MARRLGIQDVIQPVAQVTSRCRLHAVCIVVRSYGASNTSFIAWRPSLFSCWTTSMEHFTISSVSDIICNIYTLDSTLKPPNRNKINVRKPAHTQKAYMSHISVIYVHIRYIYICHICCHVCQIYVNIYEHCQIYVVSMNTYISTLVNIYTYMYSLR